jgi:hypothetical protein
MFKDMRQINPGPTLGSPQAQSLTSVLTQYNAHKQHPGKDFRQVNPGPGPMPQGQGGGLARMIALYGRPGRGAFARNAASFM